jgi:hypothetical protein
MRVVIFLMVLASYGIAQESRPQMSVRVAGEESAAAPGTAKTSKPPKRAEEKQVAQSWPKPKPTAAKKKRSGQGWCGKDCK